MKEIKSWTLAEKFPGGGKGNGKKNPKNSKKKTKK